MGKNAYSSCDLPSQLLVLKILGISLGWGGMWGELQLDQYV